MSRTLAGIVLGLCIGAGCRWFEIPVPSPPKLLGALLVVAMTIGYMGADRLITAKTAGGILPVQRNDFELSSLSPTIEREAREEMLNRLRRDR
jgi:XapX domain-containing protein